MKKGDFQFSIRGLLGLVTFVAVGCAALVNASYLWASSVWSITIGVLLAAVVASACRRGSSRAFWIGFALFGWGHMILALAPWFDDNTGEFLPSRHLLDYLGNLMGYEVPTLFEMPGIWVNLVWSRSGTNYVYLTYLVIGQSLITLVIAFCGGLLGRYFYSTREEL